MSFRRGFWERDRHGGERIIIRARQRRSSGSSLNHRENLRDLITDAEEREAALLAKNERLENDMRRIRRELSILQHSEWEQRGILANYQTLRQEHGRCGDLRRQLDHKEAELLRISRKLEKEEDKVEKLEERIRLLRRSSGYIGRDQYEEKVREVELLRTRIRDKDKTIEEKEERVLYLTGYLRNLGYRVAI
ncbi:hypothetical protein B7463_g11337, partial [Scytalidium lignicola]